jgi:hypothetical protein
VDAIVNAVSSSCSATAEPTAPFTAPGLSHGVGMVEKEDGDLLVGLLTDVDSAVNTVRGLIPIPLAPA